MEPVSLPSASEAVDAAISAGDGSTVVCWRGKDPFTAVLGQLTPFGPVVRRWSDVSEAFVLKVVDDTARAGGGAVFFSDARGQDDIDQAISRLASQRPAIPVRTGGDWPGTSQWWSAAPLKDGREFSVGDRLRVAIEKVEAGWVVRYRAEDGRNAGIHALVKDEPTPAQRMVVESAAAVVERHAYGAAAMPDGSEVRLQILMLAIPPVLARAFPDGKLPRTSDIYL